MATHQTPAPGKNIFRVTCLRPKQASMGQFMPLWNEAQRLETEIGNLSESMFQAANRGDTAAHANISAALDAKRLELQDIHAQMRPLQDKAWELADPNLVTNVGRNDILDKYWRGSGYTQTVAMGLKGSGTVAAADTMSSHAGWSEVGGANAPAYTGNRKAVTMGAASSQSSVSPQQSFAITSSGTVSGLFMVNGGSSTKDDTTGVLVSAVNFTDGDETVANLDTLLVTYTFNG